jgi:hypothetical protein
LPLDEGEPEAPEPAEPDDDAPDEDPPEAAMVIDPVAIAVAPAQSVTVNISG